MNIRTKAQEINAVPACREASETLFEERSDAVKVSKNWKNINRELSPLVGESVNRQVDERGKLEQKGKRVFYKTILNTCLSFLNEGKKRSGIQE